MVGFLAATYCRGVPVIYLPTTLLAMIDASIGGKTGVNTPLGKNLIGSVTQPHAVVMDIQTLKTLPLREWRNGIAEMIKHSLIANADLFRCLQQSVSPEAFTDPENLMSLIYQNCLIKKNVVEQDEFERGLRQLLNFGHTIGHAVETLENYKIGHGEAVAIGMLVECYLAVEAGYLDVQVLMALDDTLRGYGLPLKTQVFRDKARFLRTLILDKKSVKKTPRFVLLEGIGRPYYAEDQCTHPVLPEFIHAALEWANDYF
jgi:3-dehydroquinate synthase